MIIMATVALFACNKNDNVYLENHDSDRMMDSMHAMMAKMDTMPMTNDPEIDFANMMIIHHEGAISMANLELQEGKNDSLKNIAQMIIDVQQNEIQELTTILSSLSVDNIDSSFTMEQQMNMEKMGKVADEQLITGDIDNDFATLMIVHHQGASDNAAAYLHHGNNEELIPKAHDMIDMQTREITELSSWLKTNRR